MCEQVWVGTSVNSRLTHWQRDPSTLHNVTIQSVILSNIYTLLNVEELNDEHFLDLE